MEERTETGKGKRKRKATVAAVAFLFVLAAGAAFYYYNYRNRKTQDDTVPGLPPSMQAEAVTAAGTTATGMVEVELEFDFLDADLMVDEVYVSSADQVEAGTKVLKITDSSLKEATRELERAQMDAKLAYRQGLLDYETGKLDAENTYKQSQIAVEFAEIIYNDTLTSAESDVKKAEKEVADAQELVEEYADAENYYQDEYGVENKKAAYEKQLSLFLEKLDDYGYEMDDDDDDNPNTFNIVRSDGREGGGNDSDGEVTVLNMLKSEYQKNKEDYDQAVENYESALEKAQAGLSQAQDALALKRLELQEAQIAYEKAKTKAQADYETAQVTGQKAYDTYQTELRRLAEDLELLQDEREESAENQELFVNMLGDGYIYTEKAGEIMMVRAMENTTLSKEGILMAYSDASTITVTAAVDQSNIADIKLGETAAIVMEEYDTYTGVVTKINPVSTSTGRSCVTYSVVLELDGDISQLSANITATVYFGMTAEEMEKKQTERYGSAAGAEEDSGRERGSAVSAEEDERRQSDSVAGGENAVPESGGDRE